MDINKELEYTQEFADDFYTKEELQVLRIIENKRREN